MSDMIEVSFGDDPFEVFLSGLQPGQAVSAARLLTLLDEQPADALDELFETLADRNIKLDIRDLPAGTGDGEAAVRLRREAELVKAGNLMEGLEETDLLYQYLQEIAAIPVCGDLSVLSADLAEANRSGREDASVRSRVMDLCLCTVVELAVKYAGRGVLLMDLIQEGSMGLWQGICRYQGGDFATSRDAWITWALDRAVITQAHAAGVGQKLRRAAEDYRSVDERLLTQLGRNPTLEEIAEGLHMTVEEAAVVADMLDSARILQRAKQPEPEQLPQEQDQAVEDTAYFRMRQRIAELLSGLSQQDARLLSLRYGLEGGLPMDPGQVGSRLGLTAEEVVAREAAALSELRNHEGKEEHYG